MGKEKMPELQRTCPECGAKVPGSKSRCPECGSSFISEGNVAGGKRPPARRGRR